MIFQIIVIINYMIGTVETDVETVKKGLLKVKIKPLSV